MKDLQVKDIKNYLSTRSSIRFVWNTGESRIVCIGDFDIYSNYYITEIRGENSEIVLYIQPEI